MGTATIQHRHEPSDGDSLTTYLREIRAYPLLDRDTEIALARRGRAGDARAREQLVCSNLRFVVSVAKKYQTHGVALSDLINEGNLGLMRAAEKFDETKGVKFISYAVWWVRQAIVQALAETSHAVRVPVGRAGMVNRIARQVNGLRQELEREPTQQEIAAGMDVSEADIVSSLAISRGHLSLDAPIGDGQDAKLLDYLSDESSAAPDVDVVDRALTDTVQEALGGLRDREATVLRMYFGFDGADALTLEEIGKQMGITRERVRQIKEKALKRIRRSQQARALAAFCEH